MEELSEAKITVKLDSIAMLSCRSPYLDDSKVYVPLASLYLKSWVNKFAPHAKVLLHDDNYDLQDGDFFREYDAIGLSVMTPQRVEAYNLARQIKIQAPNTKLIIGGPHVKHYKSEVEESGLFDFIVPLDGERPLASILNGTANQRVLTDVMTKGDIETAPRPDRQSMEAVNLINRYYYELQGKRATTMMTSRGCPMACAFCEDARTVAKWSGLENLKGEMDDIKALGFQGVYLFDDLFAIAMDRVRPIANELKKRDLVYRCNGQANFFTKWGTQFADMLADTGCVEIAFGHESGSQDILNAVDKRTTVQQNYDSVRYAKDKGIKVKSFLMIGLPGENESTIAATEAFIRDAQPDDFQLVVYSPYKGTSIRDRLDAGATDIDLQFEGEKSMVYGQRGGKTEACVRTPAFSSKELLRIRDELVAKYKPKSHDHFFDTHLRGDKQYE